MKLEIWCKRGWKEGNSPIERTIAAVLVKTVDWPVAPQVGDFIIIWDGWCSEKVLDVHHSFDNNACYIEIDTDYSGEYAKKAQEKK